MPIIRGNVEKLGFKFADIKILLASHAHSDHVAGHALIKQLTGARVEVMEKFARLQKDSKTNPFVDPEGYRAYVENRDKNRPPLPAIHTVPCSPGCTIWGRICIGTSI